MLVVIASVTLLAPTLSLITHEQFSRRATEFCQAHYHTTARANCSAQFPSSSLLDIPITVDEATTKPSPIFSPDDLPCGPIHPVSPVALPRVVLDTTASCFFFRGEKAYVHVKMKSPTSNLTGVSFDYSSIQAVLDPVHIPREIAVWGLYRGPMDNLEIQQHLLSLSANPTTRPGPNGSSYILIAKEFLNPLSGGCMGILFPETLSSSRFDAFAIQVLSNWGGDPTCLAPFLFYRRLWDHP